MSQSESPDPTPEPAGKKRSRRRPLHEAIVSADLDAVLVVDELGKVVELNPAALRLLGGSRQAAIGKELFEHLFPARMRGDLRGLFLGPDCEQPDAAKQRFETLGCRPDGSEYPAELTVSRVADSEPPLRVIFLHDVSERREMLDELRRQREELEVANEEMAAANEEMVVANDELVEQRSELHDLHQQLSSLYEVGRALSSELDQQRLLQAITDAATRHCEAAFGAFFYNNVNEQGESYLLYTLSGVEREAFSDFEMPRNTAIFAPTFRGEALVRIDDVTKDPRYGKMAPHYGMPDGHLPVRSYMAIPVRSREGEVFGGLFFGHPEPGVFSEKHAELLNAIVTHAAIALENSRLYSEAQLAHEAESRRARHTALLAAIGVAFCESHELPAMLERSAQALVELTSAYFARIWLCNAPDGSTVPAATAGECPSYLRDNELVLSPEGTVGRVLQMRHAFWANRPFDDDVSIFPEASQPAAFAVLPMIVEGRLMGVVEALFAEPLPPDKSQTLEAVADVLAQGVQRKELELALHERVVQIEAGLEREARVQGQLQRLSQASLNVNQSMSREALMEVLTHQARETVGAHQAAGGLLISHTGTEVVHRASFSEAIHSGESHPVEAIELPTALCRVNRTMRFTQAELSARADWTAFALDTGLLHPLRGWLATPLHGRDGDIIGLLQVTDKIDGEFTPEDESVLAQLGQTASIALERLRLIEALRESDRAKDQFLATLAHELRNPMGAISNAIQVLKEMGTGDASAARLRDIIDRQTRHLRRLVDDLLDISRISSGKFELHREICELRPIVEHVVDTVRPTVESNQHTLTVELPPDSILLDADLTRIEQILWNLLNNSVKYTASGGQIHLSVSAMRERESPWVEIRVKDNGIGISAELLPRIFDVFTQAEQSLDRSSGGLGLGLTLVKLLVEMHGGEVHALSAGRGEGAEFVVRLPALQLGKLRTYGDAQPLAAPSRKVKVLLVEDMVEAAETLAVLLDLWGYEVAVAHNGDGAIAQFQEFKPEVVLLDIGLPGVSGYEVATQLRQMSDGHKPTLVALTGYGRREDRERTAAAGFDHHLLKPVEGDELRRLLGTLAVD